MNSTYFLSYAGSRAGVSLPHETKAGCRNLISHNIQNSLVSSIESSMTGTRTLSENNKDFYVNELVN